MLSAVGSGAAGPLRQFGFLAYFEADSNGSIEVMFGMFLGVILGVVVICNHCLDDLS